MGNDNTQFKWENKKEYDYRQKTQKVTIKIKSLLNEISNLKETGPIKSNCKNGFIELIEILEKIKVPIMYIKVNEYFLNSVKEYSEAFELLKEAKNAETKLITKAGVKINKGNTWIELSKLTIYEAIIKKEEENKNVKNR